MDTPTSRKVYTISFTEEERALMVLATATGLHMAVGQTTPAVNVLVALRDLLKHMSLDEFERFRYKLSQFVPVP